MPDDFLDDSYGGMGDVASYFNLYEEVEQEIEELRQHEYEAAQFESEYRMRITTKTAEERMHGTPVTIIDSICRGQPDIASLKLKWQKAEADAKASSHLIFLKKDKMAMLKLVIEHELYRPSNQ